MGDRPPTIGDARTLWELDDDEVAELFEEGGDE